MTFDGSAPFAGHTQQMGDATKMPSFQQGSTGVLTIQNKDTINFFVALVRQCLFFCDLKSWPDTHFESVVLSWIALCPMSSNFANVQ